VRREDDALLDDLLRFFVYMNSPCLALVGEAPHAPPCLCDNGTSGVLMTAVVTAVHIRYFTLFRGLIRLHALIKILYPKDILHC
jgi:hypothetical protein